MEFDMNKVMSGPGNPFVFNYTWNTYWQVE